MSRDEQIAAALIRALLKLRADLKAANAPLLVRLDIHKNS